MNLPQNINKQTNDMIGQLVGIGQAYENMASKIIELEKENAELKASLAEQKNVN